MAKATNEQLLREDVLKGIYDPVLERTPYGVIALSALSARYNFIAYHKTASLIEAVFAIGAHYGRNKFYAKHTKNYKRFSRQRGTLQGIGLEGGYCYQVADDEIDVMGDPAKTGKPIASDLRNHVINRIHLETFRSEEALLEERRQLYTTLKNSQASEQDILEANNTAKNYGITPAEKIIQQGKKRVRKLIRRVEGSRLGKDYLEQMVDKLVTRII